jgi:RTX calcium-binding nonapeptide repeat (4 copies)
MRMPSRRTRVALLAGVATLGIAGTASASTAVYTTDTNVLELTIDGAPGIDKVECIAGKVKFNGADPTRVPADGKTETGCAASVGLEVDEPDKTTATSNAVDLRGITRSEWTGLATATSPFAINMGGGNDTVFGTEFADAITPADGDDTVNANDGADTLIWNPGHDSDVMNGGDGRDTVVDNGGGGDEQFVVKPKVGDPNRVDASRINNPFTLDVDAEKLVVNGNGGNDSITGSVGLAGLIKTEMNGGDGDDVLVGTDGDDVQKGGAGNDSLTGARGNDDKSGDDGDDTLTWNPGDGSDKFEGGAGSDVAVDNGGGAAEHFIVSANGQRVTATRDSGAPFFLDIGTSETLDLNTGGGDDSVDVNSGLAALLKVDVNLGDGNDSIKARNDSSQLIDGAAGADSAQVDATDVVSNVESVDAPVVAPPVVTPPVVTPPADTTAPNAAIVSKKLAVERGKARVKLSLPAGESASTGRIELKRRGKVVGSKAIALTGGETKTFKIALNRKTRNALADAGKLKATVKIELTDAAGNTGNVSQKLKLAR